MNFRKHRHIWAAAILALLAASEARGAIELRQSTAVTVKYGTMVDITDGTTPETALVTHADHIRLSKNGGDYASKNSSTVQVHDEYGEWDVHLDATDTGTLGALRVKWYDVNAVPTWQDYMVTTANYWDSKYSTDIFDVSVTQWLGTAAATPTTAGVPEVDITYVAGSAVPVTTATLISDGSAAPTNFSSLAILATGEVGIDLDNTQGTLDAAEFGADFITAAKIADAAITNDQLAVDGSEFTAITAAVATAHSTTDALVTTVDTVVDAVKAKTDNLPADPASETNVNANETKIDTVDTVVDAIKAKTDNLPADPASETNVNANETKIDTVDTVVDAIKAKTDNLPTDPADDSDIDGQLAAIAAYVDQIESWLGEPVDIGHGATIAANLTALADANSGADYDPNNHSLKALRDRGDAAWITGGAGSISDILNIQSLIPNAIDLANTATVRIALGLTNMVDDLPATAEITPGTITIDRKAIGGTSWTNVVSAAACSEVAGLVYYDEVFDANSGYAAGDTVRIAFKSQKITVAANDYEITGSEGWIFHTYIRTSGVQIDHYSDTATED